jgi:hypothetical protein
MTTIENERACTTCKGSGLRACLFCNRYDRNHPGLLEDGRPCFCVTDRRATGTPGMERCNGCDGAKTFAVPVFGWLVEACFSTRGRNKGQLAVSRPSLSSIHSVHQSARLYYVWRLTRFHAGKDVTLPIMAESAIKGDPYRAELDACARLIAERVTGCGSVGTARWRGALLGEAPPAGMPWSAEEGGPVVTEGEPDGPL